MGEILAWLLFGLWGSGFMFLFIYMGMIKERDRFRFSKKHREKYIGEFLKKDDAWKGPY